MSGTTCVDRVGYLPEYWYVPPTLADLECRHGRLDDCAECEVDEHQVDEQAELEPEAVR